MPRSGLTAVADELPGTIRIQGTPAEEGPSGKTLLLNAGVFDGLDFAVIFHPWDEAFVLEKMRTGQGISFTFTGKHAHAAAHPELAIDALNGVIALFNNVNLLRQHFRPDVSVTGNIPDGGQHAFPVTAKARFGVRVFEGETDFVELRQMIVDCARAAALATRTGLTIDYGILERGMKLNETLTAATVENADHLGIDLRKRVTMGGMSDFGNVSHKVPATHFSTATWPTGVTAHTPDAVAASCQPQAFEATLAAAKIEAMTAIDLLMRADLVRACAGGVRGERSGRHPGATGRRVARMFMSAPLLVIPSLSRNLPERSGGVVFSGACARVGERFLDRLGMTT